MFFNQLFSNLNTPASIFIFLLALGVIFINGWTDAPNAIATAVCTNCLTMKKACFLCAVCNFFGVFLISGVNASVAECVFSLADFGNSAEAAVCASFITIILFGVAAWYFGMPSSESHAMLASIAGASVALNGDLCVLNGFIPVILFMIVSCICAFLLSFVVAKIFTNDKLPYKNLQILSCIGTSFMHGAQDGQKFIGIIMFLIYSGHKDSDFSVSLPLIFVVSIIMALGTSLGGGRIIKSIGENTVRLNERLGFVSDISSFICLFFSSLFGYPVSTGNIKACSVMGAGVSDRKKINKRTAANLLGVSIVTFPFCFFSGYVLAVLFSGF